MAIKHVSSFSEEGRLLLVNLNSDGTAKISYRNVDVKFDSALDIENYNPSALPLPEHTLYEALELSAKACPDHNQTLSWSQRIKFARSVIDSARPAVVQNGSRL